MTRVYLRLRSTWYVPILLVVLLTSRVYAVQDSTTLYVEKLMVDTSRSNALQYLCEHKDVRVFPLLSAIQEKKAYLEKGFWVTLGEEETQPDKTKYTLYKLYPTHA